jgi:hypothetical protein
MNIQFGKAPKRFPKHSDPNVRIRPAMETNWMDRYLLKQAISNNIGK